MSRRFAPRTNSILNCPARTMQSNRRLTLPPAALWLKIIPVVRATYVDPRTVYGFQIHKSPKARFKPPAPASGLRRAIPETKPHRQLRSITSTFRRQHVAGPEDSCILHLRCGDIRRSSTRLGANHCADLKNTTDDAILPFMVGKNKFKQNHVLTDVRLALGYSAVLISAVTFYFDYTSTWEKTKGWTLWAVVAYFILNGALTLWIWGVEKGKVFNGSKGSTLVSLNSWRNTDSLTRDCRCLLLPGLTSMNPFIA